MVVQVASLNFCQLWKRLLIARRKKRQSSFSPPRGLSFFSRFDMSSAEHLVVVVRPLVKSRPGITKHSVRHGRHGCHGASTVKWPLLYHVVQVTSQGTFCCCCWAVSQRVLWLSRSGSQDSMVWRLRLWQACQGSDRMCSFRLPLETCQATEELILSWFPKGPTLGVGGFSIRSIRCTYA